MKIVIVGCGRVGAAIADDLDRPATRSSIVDVSTEAFDRLPSTFRGNAVRGDGTDEDILRRAGAEGADVFLALTEGDNRNVMAAQLGDRGARRSRRSSPRSTTRSGPRPTPISASPRSAGPTS